MLDGQGSGIGAAQGEFGDAADRIEQDGEIDKSRVYWAMWKGKDLASALDDKQRAYFETARNRGLQGLWILAYAGHHGLTPNDLRDFATQAIGFEGDELENLRFHLNLTRSYAQRQAITALGEKAAFKTMCVNSDHQSQVKSELGDKIVNGIYSRYSEKHDKTVAESNGTFGSGVTHYRWDFKGGSRVTVQTPVTDTVMGPDGQPVRQPRLLPNGQPATIPEKVKSGAPVVTMVYPWACVRETRASGDQLWVLIRETESKWNLAAKFPAQREAILDQGTALDIWDFGQLFRLEELEFSNKDLCTVKHFYHARCDALPEGRYVVMVGSVLLWDGPCPVREGLPVAEMRASTFIETTFGYCDGWDQLAINQALNQLNSDELTNYANYGRQSVAYEKGTNVTEDGLTQGTAYEFPPGAKAPVAIQLTAPAPTLPQLKQYLHQQMDKISGQPPTFQGDPEGNVRSGEMAALLDSIALRFQSYNQQAAREFRIRGAQIILDMVDRYGETPFLVEFAGIDKRSYVGEFTRQDLEGVERVTMDVVSPMMQTVAGRLDLYMKLKDLPPEQRGAAYQLIVTGDASLFTASDRSTEMLIRRENEDLVTGQRPVVAQAGEDSSLHYKRHWEQLEAILASDNQDVQAMQRIYEHLDQTVQTFLGSSAVVANLRGVIAPPALGPSPENPAGNPSFQFQMQLMAGGAGMPAPEGSPSAGQPGTDQASSQANEGSAAQVNDSGGRPQVHPSGTSLPQPSQPAGQV